MSAIPQRVLTSLPTTSRKRWLVACAVCLAVGGGAGYSMRRPIIKTEVREREQVVDESSGLDLRQIKTETHEPTVRTRERIVYRDGPVREKIVTRVEQGGSTVTTDTKEQVHVDLHEATKEAITVSQSAEGRWSVRLLAGLDSRGGIVAGAGADYRLLGPVTVGGWATAPVAGSGNSPWTVGVSLGARF